MMGVLRPPLPRPGLMLGWWVGVVAGVRRGVGVGVVAARLGTPGEGGVRWEEGCGPGYPGLMHPVGHLAAKHKGQAT